MNIENFVNDYLQEHRHDVLLNPYNGLIDFTNAFREQMMKEAVEGYVTFNYDAQKEGLPCVTVIANEKPLEFYEGRGFKLGDKVRIIIVKED